MLDECLFSDSWGVLEWGGASGLPSSSLCLALFFLLQRDSGRCGQIRDKLDKHLWIVMGFWSFCARVSDHHEAPQKPELPPPRPRPAFPWAVARGAVLCSILLHLGFPSHSLPSLVVLGWGWAGTLCYNWGRPSEGGVQECRLPQ